MNILDQVKQFAGEYDMLRSGDRVLAAVSGGCDSVCMLHLLLALSEPMGFTVGAAHFDHELRGAESRRDAAFVAELCAKLSVPLHAGSGDVAAFARQEGLGVESAARTMRYAFLENTADAVGATRIATAHNADDNAETVLLHLVRGAGARGLGGIPPVRGRIIRPVLCLTRAEIQAYLESHGLPHVEDSTNAGDNTPRNVIRHHVMPVLRAINPRLSQGILTAGESLARDEACLSAAAEKFVREQTKAGTVSVSALEELPEAVAARVVRLLCPKAEACHVRSVLALCASPSASGQLSLPDMTVRREYDVLTFGAGKQAAIAPVILIPGSTYQLPAAGLSVTVSTCVAPNKIYKTFNTFLFKKERVCGNIIMRCRAPGDRIDCGGCGKDLKKLFIERRIPRSRRALTPVFADDRGVLAVYGIGTDRRVQCAGGEQAIRIEVKELGLTDEK